MQAYHVVLKSDVFKTYRCSRAANSLDIDVEKKSVHELKISADVTSEFNVGLILGASGSGKTSLAKKIYGPNCFKVFLDPELPVIEQFPKAMSYDECASVLAGVGLTSVPCWIRPVKTLSNGQKARAEAALAMCADETKEIVIDEWTSVVDRTVAKVMSHCVQKQARRAGKRIVLLSCHYDVIEWLNPDWIIDCNKQSFTDRRLLPEKERQRKEKLEFSIREIGRESWPYFSKYHYLSERFPGGEIYLYGLFEGKTQIGFQCFANYVARRKGNKVIFHSNRTVIHPDYAGLGLGILLINESSRLLKAKMNVKIMAAFSSTPIYKAMKKQSCWRFLGSKTIVGKQPRTLISATKSLRSNITQFSFEYIG